MNKNINFTDFFSDVSKLDGKVKVKFNIHNGNNENAIDLLIDNPNKWIEMNGHASNANNNLNNADYLVTFAKDYQKGHKLYVFGGIYKIRKENNNYKLELIELYNKYIKNLTVEINKTFQGRIRRMYPYSEVQKELNPIIYEIKEQGDENMSDKQTPEHYKNLILYGPPGTGKTYNTVVEAMKILDNDLYKKYDSEENLEEKSKIYQDEILPKFKDFKEQGRIEFITFHQSYSYEEFVEGIKPVIPYGKEWGKEPADVKYTGKDGVFKEICKRANLTFDDLYEKFKEIYPKGSEFKTIGKDSTFKILEYTDKGFKIDKNDNQNLSKDEIQTCFNQKDFSYDKNKHAASYVPAIAKKIYEISQNFSHVLIIDEINRGNISKIFGELITLIEEDKRENLKVTLPYSHEEFTVPKNLYIIGTMNTSDRSIASVDIALRRRFKFKEMMPDSNLVPEFFRKKFETLNKKISILLDRDHQIGHSYFIDIEKDDLQRVWFDSVMPLLNEYFYGDWEKLQEILGDAKEPNESDGKYQSFIKKLDMSIIRRTECQDYEGYDFVKENEIDFDLALSNAFPNKTKDNT